LLEFGISLHINNLVKIDLSDLIEATNQHIYN